MKKNRNSCIPSSYLLFVRDINILLLKRQNTGYKDGYYSVPAGHVEKGETFTQALIREVKEEINITVLPKDCHIAHIMHRKGDKTTLSIDRVDVFFTIDLFKGELKNAEPNKCSELGWASINHLPSKTIPYIKAAILAYQNVVFYSEFGW